MVTEKRGRTGGRQKGTPNRATRSFQERVEELQTAGLECDPIRVLAEIASGQRLEADGTVNEIQPTIEHRDRAKAAAELCSYMYPKRRALELEAPDGKAISFTVVHEREHEGASI